MKTVYISGQITGNPVYLAQFQNAEALLTRNGYKAINMAALLKDFSDHPWEDLMRICLNYLELADEIAMLPNWKNSRGACMEYGYAGGRGIPIRSIEDYKKED